MDYPAHPDDAEAVTISRVHYPAGRHPHGPARRVQIRVVRSGSSYAEIDLGAGLRHVFTRPGDILLSLGDRPCFFAIDEGRDLTFLQASPELADQTLRMIGGRLDDLAPLAERPFRDPMIAELCARLESQGEAPLILRHWGFGLVLALLLDTARQKRAKANVLKLTPRRLAEVENAIDAALGRAITVGELAEIVGVRERVFSAAFREATGLPVYQFVLRRRIERAVDLLQTTDLPLAQIAQRAGFTHQAHMTRVLKRLKGRTPNQFRRR